MSFDVGYEGSSGRDTTGVGNAWGTRGGSLIRRIFNAVVPVTIVERWYDPLAGSLFGITGGTPGALGFRPSVEFFSATRDWECHQINVAYPQMSNIGATAGPNEYRITTTLFTAFAGFDPIEFNPTILFGPQLITNDTFNQGTVRSQAGVAPFNNPLGFGLLLADLTTRVGARGSVLVPNRGDAWNRQYTSSGSVEAAIGLDKKLMNTYFFQRPLRVLRGRRITVQLQGLDDTFFYQPLHSLEASILYSELPNPRQSYQT